jgi:hypothetical protein
MTDERRFEELLDEFKRVGVDPDGFPAGLTIRREDAMRILRELPDDAGPAAFLGRVRLEQQAAAVRADERDERDRLSATGD